ncbi:MAG: hypothetical protein H0W84_09020 [Bacteroidetes bacterium]|nr:hypothetical protein [Bacteroidota bacterium]
MSNFKEKSQLFIMGLMVGLLIAGGFFILKLDNYFQELNFYKSIAKTFSTRNNSETIVQLEDAAPDKEKKLIVNKTKTKKTAFENDGDKTNLILNEDTLNTHSAKDSLLISGISTDDIVVRKDEFLFTKTIEIFNLSPVANQGISKDSLLEKVSGINDDKPISKQLLNTEFWQSPLNYKGYKMSKNKIVLYGITSADGIKIYKLEDVIYLKNAASIFKLDYSSDFKPFEKIADEAIINKLK